MHKELRLVPVTADRWADLRRVWLDMLAAYPGIHLENLADAMALSEGQWRERAESLTGGHRLALAVEDTSGQWVAFASAYVDDDTPERNVFVTHVYVALGDQQGAAAAELLLAEFASWAWGYRAESIILEVREDHDRVLLAYEERGFRRTGALRASAIDPDLFEVELALSLPLVPADLSGVLRRRSLT